MDKIVRNGRGAVKRFFQEFKKFISKGNVVDLAVAVIIGGAFGKIVTSLVNDMIMPLVVAAVGKHSLAELVWVLRAAELSETGEIIKAALTIKWGNFLQTIIDFLVIAFVVFLFVKVLMSVKTTGDKLSNSTKALLRQARRDLKKGIIPGKEEDSQAAESTVASEALAGAKTEPVAEAAQAEPVAAAAEQDSKSGELKSIESLLRDIRDSLAKPGK